MSETRRVGIFKGPRPVRPEWRRLASLLTPSPCGGYLACVESSRGRAEWGACLPRKPAGSVSHCPSSAHVEKAPANRLGQQPTCEADSDPIMFTLKRTLPSPLTPPVPTIPSRASLQRNYRRRPRTTDEVTGLGSTALTTPQAHYCKVDNCPPASWSQRPFTPHTITDPAVPSTVPLSPHVSRTSCAPDKPPLSQPTVTERHPNDTKGISDLKRPAMHKHCCYVMNSLLHNNSPVK
jgi:hypothetical protein